MATTPQFTPPPVVPKNPAGQMLDSQGKPIPQAPAISPDGTSIATGDQGLIWNASGPKMTPQAPAAAPAAPSTPSPDTSGGEGIFSRIGNFLTQRGPAIGDIANHLAAGAGNYHPLQAAEQEKELGLKQQSEDLQGKLAQSSMDTQALTRKHLQLENENYQSPQQKSDLAVRTARQEKPIQFYTKDGQIGQGYDDGTGNITPISMNGAPVTMPQAVGFHITGQDANGAPIVESYGKFGNPLGSAAAPTNPNAPVMPGMGKVNPMDAGAAGSLPPQASVYPGGAKDPQFRSDYTKWLGTASSAKQKNAMDLSATRNATRPITVFDPNTNTERISTLGREDKANPGGPILAGNQSGAAGVAQKAATFAELDANLANVQKYLPALATGFGKQSIAGGVALNQGHGLIGSAIEAGATSQLPPDAQSGIAALRNLRQGAASIKNVLSSTGVSDKRVDTLESELPNEADLLGGNIDQIQRKLATFTSIYNDIKQTYPQILGGGGGTHRITQSPGINQQAPPQTMPSTAAAPKKKSFAQWDSETPQ